MIKLLKLPFTIMGCIIKLGCLIMIIGIPIVVIVLIVQLT